MSPFILTITSQWNVCVDILFKSGNLFEHGYCASHFGTIFLGQVNVWECFDLIWGSNERTNEPVMHWEATCHWILQVVMGCFCRLLFDHTHGCVSTDIPFVRTVAGRAGVSGRWGLLFRGSQWPVAISSHMSFTVIKAHFLDSLNWIHSDSPRRSLPRVVWKVYGVVSPYNNTIIQIIRWGVLMFTIVCQCHCTVQGNYIVSDQNDRVYVVDVLHCTSSASILCVQIPFTLLPCTSHDVWVNKLPECSLHTEHCNVFQLPGPYMSSILFSLKLVFYGLFMRSHIFAWVLLRQLSKGL